MKLVLLVNLFTTIFMTGVIWIVQVVHYPLFSRVGTERFRSYMEDHNVLITYVVLPPMLVEAATAVLLLLLRPPQLPVWAAWTGLVLVGVIWLSTFFLQVPQHSILMNDFDDAAHRLLVSTNWVRTAAWTARSLLLGWVIWELTDL